MKPPRLLRFIEFLRQSPVGTGGQFIRYCVDRSTFKFPIPQTSTAPKAQNG
jgi:hypothetical protein